MSKGQSYFTRFCNKLFTPLAVLLLMSSLAGSLSGSSTSVSRPIDSISCLPCCLKQHRLNWGNYSPTSYWRRFTLKILAPDNQLSTCDVRRFHAAIYKQRPAEVWLFLSARTFVRGTGRLDMSESRNNTSSSVCNYGELAPLRCLLTGTRSRP